MQVERRRLQEVGNWGISYGTLLFRILRGRKWVKSTVWHRAGCEILEPGSPQL